jgi:hypothetical protein
MTIIDRHIEFYAGEVEYCEKRLRECEPREELYWKRRRNLAREVWQALKAYHKVLPV